MIQKVNYIIHLNQAFSKICDDENLSPFHVSLYFSLFQFWNIAKFRNPISIGRDELMRTSKIGSVNTYIRCLKDLHKWNYIRYEPSFNPQRGSKVHLFNFDKTNNKPQTNADNISDSKGSGKSLKKSGSNAGKTPVIPSINSINSKNKINKTKEYAHQRKKINEKSSDSNFRKTFTTGKQRKNIPPPGARREGPVLANVKKYFGQKGWPQLEAEKFFNYYQSNGWLVGGKTPMKSWKAASKNWMLNADKFSYGKEGQKTKPQNRSGRLTTSENKDYGEAL